MKKIKSLCMILLGNVLLAAGVSVFLLPNHFVSGGATGLGLIVTHFTGVPVSWCVLLFNTVFFLMGAGLLGKKFAFTTLLSTVFYPVCLNVLERFSYVGLNENPLLSALGAGVLSGIGLGLVFREGASTGGTDIPVLILNKKLGLSQEVGLYLTDGLVILGQAFFSEPMELLYGLVTMILMSLILGRMELSGLSQNQIFVVSPRYREIREVLLRSVDTGVTLIKIETGMLGEEGMAVLSVIPKRKLRQAIRLVQEEDSNAFITVHEIREVRGRGYTAKKEYIKEERET